MGGGLKLSPERTSFFGRDREQAFLLDAVRSGRRLLTITGLSGMGKTRLVRRMMEALRPGFADEEGIRYCSLIGCQTKEDLEAAILSVAGTQRKRTPELAEAIGTNRRMLLVIDNVEGLYHEVAAQVSRLLEIRPRLQIILTSVVPLEIESEVRFELGPLDVSDASALYIDRVHAVWADRVITPDDEEVVEELVNQLDRIPLAIELAAARGRVLPPREMLSRMDERFHLLRTEKSKRHGSLIRALQISWELLDPMEQWALATASVFVGGFSLDAGEEMLSLKGRSRVEGMGEEDGSRAQLRDPLWLLDSLRSKALLQADESDGTRFSVYEGVRAFVAVELGRMGHEAAAFKRHSQFFLKHGRHHAQRLVEGPHAMFSLEWLVRERENLIVAHRRCLDEDPGVSAGLGLILLSVRDWRGMAVVGQELFTSTLEAARRSGDPKLLYEALARQVEEHLHDGSLHKAQEVIDQALELCQGSGERLDEAKLRMMRSSILNPLGRFEEASEELEVVGRIASELQDVRLEARALAEQGSIEFARGSIKASERYFAQAISIFRKHGCIYSGALAQFNASLVAASLGHIRKARQGLQEASETLQRLGTSRIAAAALLNLGTLELMVGSLDEAEALTVQALRATEGNNSRTMEAIGIGTLGVIALERGKPKIAEKKLIEAVTIFEEVGNLKQRADFLPILAVVECQLGRLFEARQSLEAARNHFSVTGDRSNLMALELFDSVLELADTDSTDQSQGERLAAAKARAWLRLERNPEPGSGPALNWLLAHRILEREMASLEQAEAAGTERVLRVGPDLRWFEVVGKPRADLSRRRYLHRMFVALVEKRESMPGVGMNSEDLFEASWPGQNISPDSAANRVYTGIWTLRSMGLLGLLLHLNDGYLLDPLVEIQSREAA